jgi:hypothetical protein
LAKRAEANAGACFAERERGDVRVEDQLADLLLDRLDDVRVAVAGGADRVAGVEVHVLLAGRVPDPDILALGELEGQGLVRLQQTRHKSFFTTEPQRTQRGRTVSFSPDPPVGGRGAGPSGAAFVSFVPLW